MGNKVSYIIELKNQFSANAKKVKRSFAGINAEVEKTNKKLTEFATKAKTSFKSVAGSAGRVGAVLTATVTATIALMGRSMIKSASDAQETANKFKEVFKGIDAQSSAAVKELRKNFFLGETSAKEMLSSTGDLLVGLGLTREQALKMSMDIVKLSADVASFKNIQGGTERATIALTKALLNEKEMLKETFKVSLSEKEIKEKMLVIRRKSRGLTDAQAKAMAVLAIVTERNKDAVGDLQRTQDDYANVQRINEQATKSLAVSFGEILLPIATKVTKAITSLTEKLNELSPEMKGLILIVGGFIALAGPLLLLFAGIVAGFAAISATVITVSLSVAALIVALAALAVYWDDVVTTAKTLWHDFAMVLGGTIEQIRLNFVSLWDSIIDGVKSAVSVVMEWVAKLRAPFEWIANKLDSFNLPSIDLPDVSETTSGIKSFFGFDSAPVAPNGSVSGEIVVSAAKGSKVESTKLANDGPGLNLGLNMAGAL